MRMPFERLMEYAASLGPGDLGEAMDQLAARIGEPAGRLADAVIAVRVLAGERTCVSPAEIRAYEEPAVRRALTRDRGTPVSGCSG